jgi:hypothetical protein
VNAAGRTWGERARRPTCRAPCRHLHLIAERGACGETRVLAYNPGPSHDLERILMRALLSTIGTRGEVQPLVALALQLRVLGRGLSAVKHDQIASTVSQSVRGGAPWVVADEFSTTP